MNLLPHRTPHGSARSGEQTRSHGAYCRGVGGPRVAVMIPRAGRRHRIQARGRRARWRLVAHVAVTDIRGVEGPRFTAVLPGTTACRTLDPAKPTDSSDGSLCRQGGIVRTPESRRRGGMPQRRGRRITTGPAPRVARRRANCPAWGLHPHEGHPHRPGFGRPPAVGRRRQGRDAVRRGGRETPGATVFKITGIFDSGMEEMDRTMVLTDIRNVQRLADWTPDEISGYEIRTRSLGEAEAFARTLGRTPFYDEGDGTEKPRRRASRSVMPTSSTVEGPRCECRGHHRHHARRSLLQHDLGAADPRPRTHAHDRAPEGPPECATANSRRIFLPGGRPSSPWRGCWGNVVGVGLCLQRWTHLVKLSTRRGISSPKSPWLSTGAGGWRSMSDSSLRSSPCW